MHRFSRYVRPRRLERLVLQHRDLEILRATRHHGALTSDHVRILLFPKVNPRTVRARLRLLWSHKLLDRRFLPFTLDGLRRPGGIATTPIYTPTAKGERTLRHRASTPEPGTAPHGGQGRRLPSLQTLEHDLVVTDLLVALQAACRDDPGIKLIETIREPELRRRIRVLPPNFREDAIVPDGAFTLRYPDDTELTFFIEVVRAPVRGGNRTLVAKLERYAELQREQFFARAFSTNRLRAILILTTTSVRAGRLGDLADRHLDASRRLFWFGAYEPHVTPRVITKDTILSLQWQDTNGDRVTLLDHDLRRRERTARRARDDDRDEPEPSPKTNTQNSYDESTE